MSEGRRTRLRCDGCGMTSTFVGPLRHRRPLELRFEEVHERCVPEPKRRKRRARAPAQDTSLLPEHWVVSTLGGTFLCACGERVEAARWAHHA